MALIRAAAVSIGRRQSNFSLLTIPGRASNPLHGSVSYPQIKTEFVMAAGLRYSVSAAVQGATADSITSNTNKVNNGKEPNSPENWKVKMLYDGDCPLCMREVNMLKERNKNYEAIKFVDISFDEYSPDDNQGLDYETVMGRIHAILSDGTVVKDVEAFRKLYEAVGLGWVYAITKYEPVATIADAVYGVWAKYRLPITGRPPLEEVLEARKKKAEICNDDKACKM